MANLFGFEITRKKEEQVVSIIPPTSDDGSSIVSSGLAGYYAVSLDLEGQIKNEMDLIKRYRDAAAYPDCDTAIEDIVNEAIVSDENDKQVSLNLDDLKVSNSIKNKIHESFEEILRLLKFDEMGHDIFRSWYIDGRIYYQILADQNNLSEGIKELRNIDPRKIKRIKDITKEKTAAGVEVVKDIKEYFIYNDAGITNNTKSGVKLSLDSVVCTTSGKVEASSGITLSYLHKAVKPVNQLKMIEDALVIYRITRAPERRIFYIDVGSMPKVKAEQYVNDIMNRFRNKIVYDAHTGEVRDDKKHMSMIEDFWMPRREGGKGTEITTLQGGQNLGSLEDVNYFQQKLYSSMNVPLGRLQQQQGFSLGRSSEITRDEIKFGKFIGRLRKRFANLFLDALRVQLIFKDIITVEEWDDVRQYIRVDYKQDNFFTEFKETEILQQRVATLQGIEPYIGKFFSAKWVRKNVLRQTEEDMEEIDKENEDAEPYVPADNTPQEGMPDGQSQESN